MTVKEAREYAEAFDRKVTTTEEEDFLYIEAMQFLIEEEKNPRDMMWLGGYYYDEEHIWPSERLYRYIHRTYHEQLNSRDNGKKSKKTGNGMLEYGAYSLFG